MCVTAHADIPTQLMDIVFWHTNFILLVMRFIIMVNGNKPLTSMYNDRSQDRETIVSFGVALRGVAVALRGVAVTKYLVLHDITFRFKNRVVSY